MATATSHAGTHRAIAVTLLLLAGIVSLPLVAAFLDGESTDGVIVPVQLVVMAVVGAAVGCVLPGVAGDAATTGRGAIFGAAIGVVAGLVGVAVFFVLLNG